MKKFLVTGSAGFAGRNLCAALRARGGCGILECDIGSNSPEHLAAFAAEADFVFHLAGVNRPREESEFTAGNVDFTKTLLAALSASGRKIPVLLSSSVQAALDNPYGASKRAAEDAVFAYGRETGADVFVFRLPNVFGKWSRPNYNSAVATWCHNTARGLPVQVRDPAAQISLAHIDDVVRAFISCAEGRTPPQDGFLSVPETFTRTLGEVSSAIKSFRDARGALAVPDQSDPFARRLYSTYLSFLPEDGFAAECDAIRKKGQAYTEKELFNGEYYYQKVDIRDRSILEPYRNTAVLIGGDVEDAYWNKEAFTLPTARRTSPRYPA